MFDKKNPVEFDVIFMHETEKAVLVEYQGTKYWIPNSQIDEDSEVYVGCKLEKGEKALLICSEWIAIQKELI